MVAVTKELSLQDGGDTEQKLKPMCVSTYDDDTNGCRLPPLAGQGVVATFSPLLRLPVKTLAWHDI